MQTKTTQDLEVSVESFYIEEQSDPDQSLYTFAYRVRLFNHSPITVQLISRHWIVSDSTGEVTHVKGDGVIGEQPVLYPGQEYEYISGSRLKSPLGTMHGTYQMKTERGEMFDADIPCFNLSVPGILN